MADIKIAEMKGAQAFQQLKNDGGKPAKGFAEIMHEAMGKISQIQHDVDSAVKQLAASSYGEGDVTQAIIDMEKADLSFQLMVEVRNKLLTAYEEIMRMQV